jgi:hypothetical protein
VSSDEEYQPFSLQVAHLDFANSERRIANRDLPLNPSQSAGIYIVVITTIAGGNQ